MANEEKTYIETYKGKQFSIRKLEEKKWMWQIHGIGAEPNFCNSEEKAIAQAREAIDKEII